MKSRPRLSESGGQSATKSMKDFVTKHFKKFPESQDIPEEEIARAGIFGIDSMMSFEHSMMSLSNLSELVKNRKILPEPRLFSSPWLFSLTNNRLTQEKDIRNLERVGKRNRTPVNGGRISRLITTTALAHPQTVRGFHSPPKAADAVRLQHGLLRVLHGFLAPPARIVAATASTGGPRKKR
ncbi:hypothetical protein NDU88_001124 [Pleurodeles waltl]|uniref:Uncharacterized protein n=1 Tax=Pleurodeles waltl TaxID=8319 RepID=A0AAV7VYY6_PLEWA|nr:hypothetical protein NDU88_001124 [Pleurodeles waltl]